jgi:ribonuclease E
MEKILMSIRMLIDASHQEEIRVAIVDGNKVEDFDYESSARKQLKGSIYLAKVTRVEPSLQAAFVDYGGNRHGFLAFSEIHPDYYQIPVADREALIAQEAAANADLIENADLVEDEDSDNAKLDAKEADKKADKSENVEAENSDEKIEDEKVEEEKPKRRRGRRKKTQAEETKENVIVSSKEEVSVEADSEKGDANTEENTEEKEVKNSETAEKDPKNKKEKAADVAESSEEEEEERLRIKMAKRLRYKYKIQEVIKKNQIILIQVVKEERGNKGAALTTYLSLPGRYCVLMPNTLHGGGVSRKIANVKDRKKLKNVLASLNLPKGHACIIRTAGSDRTKVEIKRDYDYLKRMWEAIRENTLKSIAPSLIYEEGNLIKRSIRDLYTRDINEILVEGEDGYKTAKNSMSMLMPTHAKKVLNYVDPIPLFQRYQVETHLDSMYGPTAQLKSGGYIVINPTEALVSIDVNSGRATKEHNIEETAVNTNLEAADEIARQLKLRDMAGLVVIDFIDMEDQRNNRAVERKMKAALKNDRARIQVGRISSFGLMEMSRQRLRTGVLESSTTQCPHCEGSGLLRTVESQSLHILRIIEEEGIRARNSKFTVYLPPRVAVFILNNKRANLSELETRYDFSVSIAIDDELTASAYRMERSGKPSKTSRKHKDSLKLGNDVNKLIDVTEEDLSPKDEKDDRPKRRRRRRRNRNDRNANHLKNQKENAEEAKGTEAEQSNPEEDKQDKPRRRRRPRRNKRHSKEDIENKDSEDKKNENSSDENKSRASENKQSKDAVKEADEKPKRKPRRTRKKVEDEKPDTKAGADPAKKEEKVEEKPKRQRRTRKSSKTSEDVKSEDIKKDIKPSKSETATEEKLKPKRAPRKRAAKKDVAPAKEAAPKKEKAEEKPKDDQPKKKGWWSRAMS